MSNSSTHPSAPSDRGPSESPEYLRFASAHWSLRWDNSSGTLDEAPVGYEGTTPAEFRLFLQGTHVMEQSCGQGRVCDHQKHVFSQILNRLFLDSVQQAVMWVLGEEDKITVTKRQKRFTEIMRTIMTPDAALPDGIQALNLPCLHRHATTELRDRIDRRQARGLPFEDMTGPEHIWFAKLSCNTAASDAEAMTFVYPSQDHKLGRLQIGDRDLERASLAQTSITGQDPSSALSMMVHEGTFLPEAPTILHPIEIPRDLQPFHSVPGMSSLMPDADWETLAADSRPGRSRQRETYLDPSGPSWDLSRYSTSRSRSRGP